MEERSAPTEISAPQEHLRRPHKDAQSGGQRRKKTVP